MGEKKVVKEYSNGEVTIVWKPHICSHSANCFRSLPKVFDPRRRPWVNAQAADTKAIIKAIDNCPSKALSYRIENKES